MASPFKILHLEDDPADGKLVSHLLQEGGLGVEIDRVYTFPAFKQFLENNSPALILADYTVPGMDVHKALQFARQMRPEVPFVFLSGTLGEDTAVETLKMGATDYVLKQRITRLVPAVRRALQEADEQRRRRQAEEEIRRLNESLEQRVKQRTRELDEANASLQSFAHIAAHDLRSPVRAIVSYSAIVLTKYGPVLDQMGRTALKRINQSAEQVDRLLDDLLEFCRISQAELNLQPVSLQAILSEALSLLDAEVRARNAVVTVQGPLPAVLGHRTMLVLLLNNLLSNALKFVPPGIPPSVRVWAEASPSVVPVNPPAGLLRLSVHDNGIGIPPKDLDRIFGVFQRLHNKEAYPGTGLGLAIVKRVAERMGGSVGVESEPGKGSRFWLDLPQA